MQRVNGKGERVRLDATPLGPGFDRLFENRQGPGMVLNNSKGFQV